MIKKIVNKLNTKEKRDTFCDSMKECFKNSFSKIDKSNVAFGIVFFMLGMFVMAALVKVMMLGNGDMEYGRNIMNDKSQKCENRKNIKNSMGEYDNREAKKQKFFDDMYENAAQDNMQLLDNSDGVMR